MDPVRNPYAPGAGTQPPELAGREELRETVRIALARIREGKSAKSVLMVGLRGVGKTVLLDRLRSDADEAGMYTMWAEAPENRSLPSILAPQLRSTLTTIPYRESKRYCHTCTTGSCRIRTGTESQVQRYRDRFRCRTRARPGRQRRSRGRSCGSAISGRGGCT